jgi:hypothetical protein
MVNAMVTTSGRLEIGLAVYPTAALAITAGLSIA